MKRLIIHVSGRVQGVFFRASVKTMADRLGISGIVRNENNGDVYLEAEGNRLALREFEDWCKKGPPNAQVLKFVIEETEPVGYVGFRIVR